MALFADTSHWTPCSETRGVSFFIWQWNDPPCLRCGAVTVDGVYEIHEPYETPVIGCQHSLVRVHPYLWWWCNHEVEEMNEEVSLHISSFEDTTLMSFWRHMDWLCSFHYLCIKRNTYVFLPLCDYISRQWCSYIYVIQVYFTSPVLFYFSLVKWCLYPENYIRTSNEQSAWVRFEGKSENPEHSTHIPL